MKPLAALVLLLPVLAFAQAAPAPTTLLTLPPDTVVATIDGQKVLAADLQAIMRALSPQQQEANLKNPRMFLEQYGLMKRLSGLGEKAGLDQKSPLKEQLAYGRMLGLAQAQLQASQDQVKITPDDIQKFYDTNKDGYTQARIKVIYVPFSANPTSDQNASDKRTLSESDAKAKAEKLYADLQAGADFVKLVKENSGDSASASKDGDFGTIRRSDQIPEEIKGAIFDLKPGQVSKPVRQPNGFYIFRAEEIGTEPLEKVRAQISERLTSSRMTQSVEDLRKSLAIKIENEAAFGPAPVAK